MHYYNFIWVAMSESDRCTLHFYALDKREWKLFLKFDFWFISLFDFIDHNTETKMFHQITNAKSVKLVF